MEICEYVTGYSYRKICISAKNEYVVTRNKLNLNASLFIRCLFCEFILYLHVKQVNKICEVMNNCISSDAQNFIINS